jgi:hypothetical protein
VGSKFFNDLKPTKAREFTPAVVKKLSLTVIAGMPKDSQKLPEPASQPSMNTNR